MLVTELMRGGSLYSAIHGSGGKAPMDALGRAAVRVAPPAKQRIALDVARGLSYLHAVDMLHRDLTSSNVLLVEPPSAWLARYALAPTLSSGEALAKIGDFGMSRSKSWYMTQCTGNLLYLAPEVFRGEKHTEAADVYAFAIVLNELWTELAPFVDAVGPQQAAFAAAQSGRRPDVLEGGHVPGTCPPQILEIIKSGWAHDLHQRPAMADIVRLLEALQAGDNHACAADATEAPADGTGNYDQFSGLVAARAGPPPALSPAAWH